MLALTESERLLIKSVRADVHRALKPRALVAFIGLVRLFPGGSGHSTIRAVAQHTRQGSSTVHEAMCELEQAGVLTRVMPTDAQPRTMYLLSQHRE